MIAATRITTRPYRIALLMTAALMAGCEAQADSAPTNFTGGMEMFKDIETGCEYLGFVWVKHAAITPRIAADGISQSGCKELSK